MKLYFFPIAPNPTKVRLYVAEKRAAGGKVDLTEELVDLPKGEQRKPAHLARNQLGRLPVLELDDGTYLTESLAIIEYLEEISPEPPMIGRTALAGNFIVDPQKSYLLGKDLRRAYVRLPDSVQ